MSNLTVNGHGVVDAVICMPRIGAWHIDAVVSHNAAPSGTVTAKIGDWTLKGTAHRVGVYVDTIYIRIVAGAGGLAKLAKPKHYSLATVKIVLTDLCSGAGETVSATADAAMVGRQLTAWTTFKMPTSSAISALVQSAPAASWRLKQDGMLWIGVESWPKSKATDYVIVASTPQEHRIEVGSDVPKIEPGTIFEGGRVSYVEHRITPERLRSSVFYE